MISSTHRKNNYCKMFGKIFKWTNIFDILCLYFPHVFAFPDSQLRQHHTSHRGCVLPLPRQPNTTHQVNRLHSCNTFPFDWTTSVISVLFKEFLREFLNFATDPFTDTFSNSRKESVEQNIYKYCIDAFLYLYVNIGGIQIYLGAINPWTTALTTSERWDARGRLALVRCTSNEGSFQETTGQILLQSG